MKIDWVRDEIILALDLYFDPERGPIGPKNSKVKVLSELLNRLPIHQYKPDKFRNANGVAMKLNNFLPFDIGYSGNGLKNTNKLDHQIFNEFKNNIPLLNQIALKIKSIAHDPVLANALQSIAGDPAGEYVGREGLALYKLHKYRERDRKLVEEKKKQHLKNNQSLDCEKCGFNFEKTYGKVGRGFIECHHVIPLSRFTVETKTKLSDLILLCANCHRIEHRRLAK